LDKTHLKQSRTIPSLLPFFLKQEAAHFAATSLAITSGVTCACIILRIIYHSVDTQSWYLQKTSSPRPAECQNQIARIADISDRSICCDDHTHRFLQSSHGIQAAESVKTQADGIQRTTLSIFIVSAKSSNITSSSLSRGITRSSVDLNTYYD
jgi:hypothetical protein